MQAIMEKQSQGRFEFCVCSRRFDAAVSILDGYLRVTLHVSLDFCAQSSCISLYVVQDCQMLVKIQDAIQMQIQFTKVKHIYTF
jgi:hypothetical protein